MNWKRTVVALVVVLVAVAGLIGLGYAAYRLGYAQGAVRLGSLGAMPRFERAFPELPERGMFIPRYRMHVPERLSIGLSGPGLPWVALSALLLGSAVLGSAATLLISWALGSGRAGGSPDRSGEDKPAEAEAG